MASENIELRWVKPPRQDRSRDTHDRFVDAAQRLLANGRSFHEISVAELAKEAEASVGAFYNRFRDKDALLHVLQIELHKEGEATAREVLVPARWTGASLEALIRAFVGLSVSSYRQQRGLRRALLVQMASDEQFRARSVALSRLTCEGLTDVLHARSPMLPRAKVRTLIDVCHRMVFGVLEQELLFAEEPPTGQPLDDQQLSEQLATACFAYLRTSDLDVASR